MTYESYEGINLILSSASRHYVSFRLADHSSSYSHFKRFQCCFCHSFVESAFSVLYTTILHTLSILPFSSSRYIRIRYEDLESTFIQHIYAQNDEIKQQKSVNNKRPKLNSQFCILLSMNNSELIQILKEQIILKKVSSEAMQIKLLCHS